MSDTALAMLWLAALGAGLAVCVAARALGLAVTHVRDLLHVGTGVWVLGWTSWHGAAAPLAIVLGALVGVLALPMLALRLRPLGKLRDSVSDAEERWSGIVMYVAAYAGMTALGLSWGQAFPAAAALWALSLGDGLGGAVGRAFGRRRYRVPGGKSKSLEGSAAVALFSALGVWASALWLDAAAPWPAVAGAGLVAAVAEALAPRASDNLLVPGAVAAFLALAA
jgi:dolichol kinase